MTDYSTHLQPTRESISQPITRRPLLFMAAFLLFLLAAFAPPAPQFWGEKNVSPQSGGEASVHLPNSQRNYTTHASFAGQRVLLPPELGGGGGAFELLSPTAGWLWSGSDLYWTTDSGDTWGRITPALPTATLAAVFFLDTHTGWVLLRAASSPATLTLAVTDDAGQRWHLRELALSPPELLRGGGTFSLALVDAHTGFLTLSRSGSSNFSAGALWQTSDGGATWSPRTLPIGDPVHFIDDWQGWAAGGVAGADLWRTLDGGRSWVEQALPVPATGDAVRRTHYAPLWAVDRVQGLIPVLARAQGIQSVEWYTTADGGNTWRLAHSFVPASVAAGALLGDVDPRVWLMEQSGQALLPPSQALPFFANLPVDAAQRIAMLKMATPLTGWALAEPGHALLRTQDGGRTWQPLSLLLLATGAETTGAAAAEQGTIVPPDANGTRTSVVRGAGVDICDLPDPAELATWFTASPYRVVNLYIGGVLRGCANERLTAPVLAQLAAQGWTFIPTWVGPQAPCSAFRARFSSDPGTAFAQGSAEADAAAAAAQALGLAEADRSGAIVYYDLEGFDADAACLDAAQAFVAGWTSRLHALGNQAGLYGSACNPRIERFAAGAPAPDAVWVAQWNREFYDPSIGVFGIACLPDSLWAQSQRIRQYAGGHDETWGGVTLNVDSNVVDSLVADPLKPLLSVTVEAADLTPAYSDGMCGSGWYLSINDRGYPAVLAANRELAGTIPPPPVARTATWRAPIAVAGFYRVEAYIPAHAAVEWRCPDLLLPADTASAHYTIEHAEGSTLKVANQAIYSNSWLLLGIYPFAEGNAGLVSLGDATAETATTRTVSASALRFTRVPAGSLASEFIYLPAIER